MDVQASREDRIKAATAVIGNQTLFNSPLIGGIDIPANVAKALAELAVDAVVAADAGATRKWHADRAARVERLRRDIAEGRAIAKAETP